MNLDRMLLEFINSNCARMATILCISKAEALMLYTTIFGGYALIILNRGKQK